MIVLAVIAGVVLLIAVTSVVGARRGTPPSLGPTDQGTEAGRSAAQWTQGAGFGGGAPE